MISFTKGQQDFAILTQNTTSDNLALYGTLANFEHRYLLQKYFSNEASYTFTTIGSQNLTMTATVPIGAVSATLTSPWAYPNAQTIVTFSDGEQRNAVFINGSSTFTWTNALVGTSFVLTGSLLTGATSATLGSLWVAPSGVYLTQFSDGETRNVTFTNNSGAITWVGGLSGPVNNTIMTSVITVALGVGGVQSYRLPPDYSKLKTGTLTIGNLKWTPTEIFTREEWDRLNVFPYYADIPSNFFIWNNQFNFWPIPSTTGNTISYNYKRRIPDLSLADYTTPGTISVANNGSTITGVGTSFIPTSNVVAESRWIQIAQPAGDNLWYEIQSVDSTTSITLSSPYQGITVSGSSTYTIGQMPLLIEDFHDMLLWKALVYYFTSIVDNQGKREQYEMMYNEKLELLSEYAGQKTLQVNLSRRPYRGNPNLYPQGIGL